MMLRKEKKKKILKVLKFGVKLKIVENGRPDMVDSSRFFFNNKLGVIGA